MAVVGEATAGGAAGPSATQTPSAAVHRTLGGRVPLTPMHTAAAPSMLMGKAPLIPICTEAAQRTTKEEAGRRPAPTVGRPTAMPTTAVHTTIRQVQPTLATIRLS